MVQRNKFTFGYCAVILLLSAYTLVCLLPMLLVLSVSLSSDASLRQFGVQLIPREFSLDAYRMLASSSDSLLRSYGVTSLITVVGTCLAMLITLMAAFSLSNRGFRLRRGFSLYFYFTMLFSGGMVPWYMINKQIGLYDNIWALIIPSMVFSPYNMFLVRNYMKSLPESLMDAARIDGANEVVIAFKIYIPLCLPVIAAVSLFYGLNYWNSWWNCLMLTDDTRYRTLQTLLLNIRSQLKALELNVTSFKVPSQPMQNATTLVSIGPIILLYPFIQRYFVKGMVVGAVKG